MDKINKSKIKSNFLRICKGSIISIVITLLLLFVFSIILTYTNLQENVISPVIIIITAISILIGSSISTMHINKNGLLNGAFVGLIYIIIIYILSSVINASFSLNINSIIMIFSSVLAGMIGGIIGINI